MMNPTDEQPYDVEKDASASETEDSHHSHPDGEGSHLSHAEVASSRRPILCGGISALVVLGLVVIALPLALTERDRNEAGRLVTNSESMNIVDLAPQEDTPVPQEESPVAPVDISSEPEEIPSVSEPVGVWQMDRCFGHSEQEGDYYEVSQVWFETLGRLGAPGLADMRTFEVQPSHTVLENGVVFNVETVTEALPEDLAKPILTTEEIESQIQEEASKFYQNITNDMPFVIPPLPNVTLEVISRDDLPLVYAGNQGFLAACMMSFAQHLPLALTPDHLWTVIAQGFARHVDENAEELRHQFVDHEGKKEIKIREDTMAKGGSPPEQWEELIFPRFSEEIGRNMNNEEAYQTLSEKTFSTSTAITQAASEIVLMAAMKNFFQFTMVTACGIPQIRLEGTRGDWVALRDRSEKLAQWMLQNNTHGDLWIHDIVLPILDQFVLSYDGKVNYCFWQNIVKFRTTGMGSGSYEFLSGWLPTLFPYLDIGGGETEANPFFQRHWEESTSPSALGPKPSQIPNQISSVPVMWEYFDTQFPLHFHAGFRGVTQEADGTLSPVLGYYVTNDPEGDQ